MRKICRHCRRWEQGRSSPSGLLTKDPRATARGSFGFKRMDELIPSASPGDGEVTPQAQPEASQTELRMRYTLWSRGRLVGHTALDIHTMTCGMRQGFVEPTLEGRQILADATGVWRTMAEVKRGGRV